MNIETLLHDEIKDELEQLKKMELGSETYKITVDGVVKLVDRAIEMEKLGAERLEKEEAIEFENEFRLNQAKEEKTDRYVRNGIAIAGIIIPATITIWGTVKSFEFEKEGVITTIMGRGFINKLLPKK